MDTKSAFDRFWERELRLDFCGFGNKNGGNGDSVEGGRKWHVKLNFPRRSKV